MLTRDDVEGFLDRLYAEGVSYSEMEPGALDHSTRR